MKKVVMVLLALLVSTVTPAFAEGQSASIFLVSQNSIKFICGAANPPFQVSYIEDGVFRTWPSVADGETIPVSAGSTYELYYVKDCIGRMVEIDSRHKTVYNTEVELIFNLPPEIGWNQTYLALENLFSTNPPLSQYYLAQVSFQGQGVVGGNFYPANLSGDIPITVTFRWDNITKSATRWIRVIPDVVIDILCDDRYCYDNQPITAGYTCNINVNLLYYRVDGQIIVGNILPIMNVGIHYLEVFCTSYNNEAYSDGKYFVVEETPNVVLNLPLHHMLQTQAILLSGGQPEGGVYAGDCVEQIGGSYYFLPNHTGNYVIHYKYTTIGGCTGEASGTIYVCPSGFGVDEDQGLGVEVYPNPAVDKLNIEVQEPIGTVEIYNIMGVLVHSQDVYSNKGELDISILPNGMYFVRTPLFTRRFVKQ